MLQPRFLRLFNADSAPAAVEVMSAAVEVMSAAVEVMAVGS